MNQQQALAHARSLIEGGMTPGEANVEMIRIEGFRLIHGTIQRETRAALNAAVKAGRLGRLPKQGLRPEAYFHPNSEWKAKDARTAEFNRAIRAIKNTCQ